MCEDVRTSGTLTFCACASTQIYMQNHYEDIRRQHIHVAIKISPMMPPIPLQNLCATMILLSIRWWNVLEKQVGIHTQEWGGELVIPPCITIAALEICDLFQ